MKKLYTLALSALLVPAFAMADEYFENYAAYQGTSSHSGARGCNTMTVSTSGGNSVTIQGTGTTNHAIYKDATDTKLVVKPGETISITGTSGNAEWMHNYVYVDFGQDGQFDVDVTTTDLNGDLVSHSGYSLTSNGKYGTNLDTADPTVNSDGKTISNGNYWDDTPDFTLPEDLQPGEYRIRLKNDWNSTHPYGRTNETITGDQKQNNNINANGGFIIDFTLVVEEQYSIRFNDECEYVAIYADADLTTLVGSSLENSNEQFTYTKSALTDGLYFEFNAPEGKVLSQFTINLEEIDVAEVQNGVYHVALDEVPAPEGWDMYMQYYGYPNLLVYVEYANDPLAGVEEIAVDAEGEVEYFNLQGVKVAADNMTNGVYVARQGEKTTKVLINK